MTLLNRLLENAVGVDKGEAEALVGPLLTADEEVTHAYIVGIRDMLFFTNKRLISCDKQELSGKKKNIVSYLWNNLFYWTVTSAGNFDFDTELTIAAKGMVFPDPNAQVAPPPIDFSAESPTSVLDSSPAVPAGPQPTGPLVITFSKDTDIQAVARAISSYVLLA